MLWVIMKTNNLKPSDCPLSGILLRPLLFENRKGETVCIPAGAQLGFIADDNAYSDISEKDMDEAVKLLDEE